ncbi:MAG: helix-turn-helix domain-containing protein, partial [Aeoliella sp.]
MSSALPASAASVSSQQEAQLVAYNLRRLMARQGITYDDVVEASGLDGRTIRGIARGEKKPHAKSLHRLAGAFGVSADELYLDAATFVAASFDEATNPVVGQVVEEHSEVFEGWSSRDFAELYSRFGHGGQFTEEGALEAAEQMNGKRQVVNQVRVILESA